MQTAALFAAAFVALLYVVEVIDISVGNRLDDAGVRPREVDGVKDLRRPAKPYLQVARGQHWIADCTSPAEVAEHVDLAQLEPLGAPA